MEASIRFGERKRGKDKILHEFEERERDEGSLSRLSKKASLSLSNLTFQACHGD